MFNGATTHDPRTRYPPNRTCPTCRSKSTGIIKLFGLNMGHAHHHAQVPAVVHGVAVEMPADKTAAHALAKTGRAKASQPPPEEECVDLTGDEARPVTRLAAAAAVATASSSSNTNTNHHVELRNLREELENQKRLWNQRLLTQERNHAQTLQSQETAYRTQLELTIQTAQQENQVSPSSHRIAIFVVLVVNRC